MSPLILSSSLYGKPFARRWTRESGGLGLVRFVQTDFPTSRGAVRRGTMRWRHSWGGDALWVSFVFENQRTSLEHSSVRLRQIGRSQSSKKKKTQRYSPRDNRHSALKWLTKEFSESAEEILIIAMIIIMINYYVAQKFHTVPSFLMKIARLP